jgi:hypothetical protein
MPAHCPTYSGERWTTVELNALKEAAKRGVRVYEQVYFELRPDSGGHE